MLLGRPPDAVEHGLVLGGRLGAGPLGAHHLPRVLLLARLAVLALVELGLRHTVLPQDLGRPKRGGLRLSPGHARGPAQERGGRGGYLGELVLQHLFGGPDIGEEEVEEVARRLGVDLLFAKINVRHFDGLCWSQAQHLLRVGTALKYLRQHLSGPRHQLLTCHREGGQMILP